MDGDSGSSSTHEITQGLLHAVESATRVVTEKLEARLDDSFAPLQQQISQLKEEFAIAGRSRRCVPVLSPVTCKSAATRGLNNLVATLRIAHRSGEQHDYVGADAALVGLALAMSSSNARQGKRSHRRPPLTVCKREAAEAFVRHHDHFELCETYIHHTLSGR